MGGVVGWGGDVARGMGWVDNSLPQLVRVVAVDGSCHTDRSCSDEC